MRQPGTIIAIGTDSSTATVLAGGRRVESLG